VKSHGKRAIYVNILIVDTYNDSKEDCADRVIEALNYPDKFSAFKILWTMETIQEK